MPTWLPITFKMCAYSWGPRVWGDAPLHRGSRAASLTLVLDEHISPWKSAWRGAPGRPRVPWLPARFPSQGAPAPAAAHQASRTPGWAPIWGWSAACGWPGAGAGTVSWAPPPHHRHSCRLRGLCKVLTSPRAPSPSGTWGGMQKQLFLLIIWEFNNLLWRGSLGRVRLPWKQDAARHHQHASVTLSETSFEAGYASSLTLDGHTFQKIEWNKEI